MLGFLSRLFRKPEPIRAWVDGWQATPTMPMEIMLALIQRTPPPLWPTANVPGYGHWHEWGVTKAAHRELMRRFVHSLPPYPHGDHEGRGIVICAGGWKYFPSTYVTVRTLRELGCTLPIELWYLGSLNEFDEKMEWILRDYKVSWIDANAVAQVKGLEPRYLGSFEDGYPPWELKAFAVLHSRFEQVMSLDADSTPIDDPSFLFDRDEFKDKDFFWPDRVGPMRDPAWATFGIRRPPNPVSEVESGQFVVDKRRSWAEINVANLLCDHRDFVFRQGMERGVYGDKTAFEIAWYFVHQFLRKRSHKEIPFVQPWPLPGFVENCYIQLGFDGMPLFVHRTHRKLMLPEGDGRFKSGHFGVEMHEIRDIPNDKRAKEMLRELDQLVNPGATDRRNFRLRPGTADSTVWDEVVVRNDYRLPIRFEPGTVVLDLGANIGAFTHAALTRGAEFVYGVEPAPSNLASLQRNLAQWRNRIKLYYGACWRSGRRERFLSLNRLDAPEHSAQWALDPINFQGKRTEGQPVRTVRLDTLLKRIRKRHGGWIILKIDVEGAEYAILSTATQLHHVDAIYGEWHRATWDGKEWGPDDLRGVLEGAGFAFEFDDDDSHAHFWARRSG